MRKTLERLLKIYRESEGKDLVRKAWIEGVTIDGSGQKKKYYEGDTSVRFFNTGYGASIFIYKDNRTMSIDYSREEVTEILGTDIWEE